MREVNEENYQRIFETMIPFWCQCSGDCGFAITYKAGQLE